MSDNRSFLMAAALGASLTYITLQQEADAGLPSPTISYGMNPIVSSGGSAVSGQTQTIVTAPSDQDIIITDVALSSYSTMTCKRNHHSQLLLSNGDILGEYETHSSISRGSYSSSSGMSIQLSLTSGLRVPAGETLSLTINETGTDGANCGSHSTYGVRYMLTGYLANP